MLRYYSYYSVGGYKDFSLGNSESQDESTFYFPLLPVLEERAKSDSEVAKQIAEFKNLPAINQLSTENSYGLPSSANILFSHAGYKLIYKSLGSDKYAIALRDISQNSKDETGRTIPFLFVIVGDSADIRILDILATYIACNVKQVEKNLSQLLYMDMDKNGLRFELAKFNNWIKETVKHSSSTTIPTISGGLKIHATQNKVALILLPSGISIAKAISEQKLEGYEIVSVPQLEIISKEDPDKLVDLLLHVSKQLQGERKRNEILKKGLLAAGIGGFLVGSIIASCCHK